MLPKKRKFIPPEYETFPVSPTSGNIPEDKGHYEAEEGGIDLSCKTRPRSPEQQQQQPREPTAFKRISRQVPSQSRYRVTFDILIPRTELNTLSVKNM